MENNLEIKFDENTDLISVKNTTTGDFHVIPASSARYTAALSGELTPDSMVGAAVSHVVDGLVLRKATMYVIQNIATGDMTLAFKDNDTREVTKVVMEDDFEPLEMEYSKEYVTSLNGELIETEADTVEEICNEIQVRGDLK